MKTIVTLMLLLGCSLLARTQPLPPVPGNPVAGAPVPTPMPTPAASKIEVSYFPFKDANTYALTDSAILPVILAYARLNDPSLQAEQLSRYFVTNPNPYLEAFIRDYIAKRSTTEATPSSTGAQGGGAGLGLFPATQILDGVGTFLADRFKKELTIAYLDQMKKQIVKADSLYAVSALLPETYSTFNHLDEIFNYKVYLNTLKEGVKQDMHKLPDNIFPFAEALYNKGRITDIPKNEFYTLLYGTYLFKESAYNGRNLLLQLTQAKDNHLLNQIDSSDNTRNALLFLGGFMTGYLKSDNNFINAADINTLRQSIRKRDLFRDLCLKKSGRIYPG